MIWLILLLGLAGMIGGVCAAYIWYDELDRGWD